MARMNRASRSNMAFLKITMALGILLLVVVSLLWYLAFKNSKSTEGYAIYYSYSIGFSDSMEGDSVSVVVNDSVVYDGIVENANETVCKAGGNNAGNMITAHDYSSDKTYNSNLPFNDAKITISKDNGEIKFDISE